MTVNVLYTVWCDGKRADGSGDCGAWITGDTAWEATRRRPGSGLDVRQEPQEPRPVSDARAGGGDMTPVHADELTPEDLDALVAGFDQLLDVDAGELVAA